LPATERHRGGNAASRSVSGPEAPVKEKACRCQNAIEMSSFWPLSKCPPPRVLGGRTIRPTILRGRRIPGTTTSPFLVPAAPQLPPPLRGIFLPPCEGNRPARHRPRAELQVMPVKAHRHRPVPTQLDHHLPAPLPRPPRRLQLVNAVLEPNRVVI